MTSADKTQLKTLIKGSVFSFTRHTFEKWVGERKLPIRKIGYKTYISEVETDSFSCCSFDLKISKNSVYLNFNGLNTKSRTKHTRNPHNT